MQQEQIDARTEDMQTDVRAEDKIADDREVAAKAIVAEVEGAERLEAGNRWGFDER